MNYYYLGFISLVLTIAAQLYVSFIYNKYKNVSNGKGLSGFDIAKSLLDANDISDIYVVESKGYLSDHYDPSARVIRLSSDVFHGESVASAAIAAHEVGHAIQYKEGNKLIKIRSILLPFINFCSRFGYIVIMFGIFFSSLRIFYVGIFMLSAILLFQILTLPVEIDASKKAVRELSDNIFLSSNENDASKKVLIAAALTYVASLATTVIEILRLVIMANNDRR